MAYSKKSTDQTEYPDTSEMSGPKEYYKSTKPNPYLKGVQIMDMSKYVDDKTINVIDADTLAFQVASSVEEDYIEVYFKDKLVVECENVTKFKGGKRNGVIDEKSWLGNFNMKQVAKGKKEYAVEDFDIKRCKRLKHDNGCTIDGIEFNDTTEVAEYFIDSWIEAIKVQTEVKNVLPILGQGEVHRHLLPLPKPYKYGRAEERPILLKHIRQYILDRHKGKMATEGFEADEVVDLYGRVGYDAYKKTGKFKFIKSSPDKDAGNKESIWFNYDKSFNFKVPQPVMILPFKDCVGVVEPDGDKIRGVGLKHLCFQLLMGDSADKYGPRTYLPEDVRPNVKYGNTSFFKDFAPLKTQKEVLQKLVDKFMEWFPEGVAYKAYNGSIISEPDAEVEVYSQLNGEYTEFDTLGYMELLFSCAYMKEGSKDTRVLEDYLKQFDVDYKKAVNNRITEDTPLVEDEELEKIVHEAKAKIAEALAELEKKSGTKPVLVEKMGTVEEILNEVNDQLRSMFDTGA